MFSYKQTKRMTYLQSFIKIGVTVQEISHHRYLNYRQTIFKISRRVIDLTSYRQSFERNLSMKIYVVPEEHSSNWTWNSFSDKMLLIFQYLIDNMITGFCYNREPGHVFTSCQRQDIWGEWRRPYWISKRGSHIRESFSNINHGLNISLPISVSLTLTLFIPSLHSPSHSHLTCFQIWNNCNLIWVIKWCKSYVDNYLHYDQW